MVLVRRVYWGAKQVGDDTERTRVGVVVVGVVVAGVVVIGVAVVGGGYLLPMNAQCYLLLPPPSPLPYHRYYCCYDGYFP